MFKGNSVFQIPRMRRRLFPPYQKLYGHQLLKLVHSIFHDRCPLGSGHHRVKILIACLIACLLDSPTFSYSPARAYGDIVVEGDVLEEVKTIKKTILELIWVMPHSGFGATLNPDPSKKLLNCLLGSPLMNIYGSSQGPSAVVYHALRNFWFCKLYRVALSWVSVGFWQLGPWMGRPNLDIMSKSLMLFCWMLSLSSF